jgi:PAS domain S-box-containing protein
MNDRPSSLSESGDYYRELYDFAPIAYVVLSTEGRILESNRTAAAMLGGELLGADISGFVSTECLEDWNAYRVAAFASEARRACDIMMRRTDGTLLAVRVEGVTFGPKESRRCRTALIDTTERKLLEEQLRLAEARASGILSVSTDAIISIDERQRITLFSEGAERIFGYSSAEAIGASLDILIPQRFRATHGEHVRQFLAGREFGRRVGGKTVVVYGRRRDGQEFPAHAAISKVDMGGKPIMTVALSDISEQTCVENEQTFLAEVSSVLASTLDYDDTLRNIARLAVRDLADFFSLDVVEEKGGIRRLGVMCRDASQGWVCDILMQVPLRPGCPSLIRSVLETRRSVLIERLSDEAVASFTGEADLPRLRSAGFKSVIAAPLLAHGTLVGVMALVSSSPEKLYSPADLRLAEALAQRSALSIANARLFAEVQRAVRTREEVLAIVSHDLKNPVSTIKLVSHLLRQTERIDVTRIKNFADTLQRSVDKMLLLIADLLDFDKIQSGALAVETETESVNQVVAPVIDGFKLLAENQGQTLLLDLATGLPEVSVDKHRIGQVISNLLGNAIKFTPRGGTIRVSARREGNEVVVSVEDTGVGIPREHLSKVFEWFWQAERSKHMGSGLGLSIAKAIIEAHRGRIWAESRVGKGTTFSFTLAVADDVKRRAA